MKLLKFSVIKLIIALNFSAYSMEIDTKKRQREPEKQEQNKKQKVANNSNQKKYTKRVEELYKFFKACKTQENSEQDYLDYSYNIDNIYDEFTLVKIKKTLTDLPIEVDIIILEQALKDITNNFVKDITQDNLEIENGLTDIILKFNKILRDFKNTYPGYLRIEFRQSNIFRHISNYFKNLIIEKLKNLKPEIKQKNLTALLNNYAQALQKFCNVEDKKLNDLYYYIGEESVDELLNQAKEIKNSTEISKISFSHENQFDLLQLNLKLGFWWILAGADVNTKNSSGQTMLIYAVQLEDIELVKALINLKAEINLRDYELLAQFNDGNTALTIAIHHQNPEIVKLLLDAGAEPTLEDQDPLICAITDYSYNSNKGKKIINLLLDAGAEINSQNQRGYTPLMIAASECNFDVIKLLLNKGAEVNLESEEEETALTLVNLDYSSKELSLYTINLIKLLLDHGANINSQSDSDQGNTLLIKAIKQSNCKKAQEEKEFYINLIKFLLEYKIDTNLLNYDEETALEIAIDNLVKNQEQDNENQEYYISIIKLLLEHGADVKLPNSNDQTALEVAINNFQVALVKLLLNYNSDLILVANINGYIPSEYIEIKKANLTKAYRQKKQQIVSIQSKISDLKIIDRLIKSYEYQQTDNNNTNSVFDSISLMSAIQNFNIEGAEKLLDKGVDLTTVKNLAGYTVKQLIESMPSSLKKDLIIFNAYLKSIKDNINNLKAIAKIIKNYKKKK